MFDDKDNMMMSKCVLLSELSLLHRSLFLPQNKKNIYIIVTFPQF